MSSPVARLASVDISLSPPPAETVGGSADARAGSVAIETPPPTAAFPGSEAIVTLAEGAPYADA